MTLVICSIIALIGVLAFVFRSNLFGRHPLSGIRVKLCQQSSVDHAIVATGLTDRNGNIEFNHVPTDVDYYVEFEGVKKGLNKQSLSLMIEGIKLKNTPNKPANQQTKSPSRFVFKKWARAEATVTYHDDWIKASILG
jgi:hypothetical protein